jgi:hypothetical protein
MPSNQVTSALNILRRTPIQDIEQVRVDAFQAWCSSTDVNSKFEKRVSLEREIQFGCSLSIAILL